jgi:hypothetical protein
MLLSRDHGLATGLLFPKNYSTELLHTDFGARAVSELAACRCVLVVG